MGNSISCFNFNGVPDGSTILELPAAAAIRKMHTDSLEQSLAAAGWKTYVSVGKKLDLSGLQESTALAGPEQSAHEQGGAIEAIRDVAGR